MGVLIVFFGMFLLILIAALVLLHDLFQGGGQVPQGQFKVVDVQEVVRQEIGLHDIERDDVDSLTRRIEDALEDAGMVPVTQSEEEAVYEHARD